MKKNFKNYKMINERYILRGDQNDEKKAISNNSNIFDIYNWNET